MGLFSYNQHDGYDKYKDSDDDGNKRISGRADYDKDGALTRMSNIYPHPETDTHDHEWMNIRPDGSVEYKYDPDHPNHR